MTNEIDYWNVKVYNSKGQERETLRGLTYARMTTLVQIFKREEIQAQAIPYNEDGRIVEGETQSVNWE